MLKLKRCGFIFVIILFCHSDIALCKQNTPLELEPIVITKSKACLLDNYSLEYGVLKNLPFGSFIEALSLLPLDLQSRSLKGGIQTDFSLRGSNFQGVLVLVDGQRINDPQTAHHNSDIPFTREDIERIEVIPGLGSSLYGPDAIGGAINIILKKPKGRKMVLESGFGRYETKSGLFSISDKIGDLAVRFSIDDQESEGFRNDTDFKKFTATLNSSWDMPDGEFVFNSGYLEKEFGAYDFYTPGLGYPSKEWTKTYLLTTGFNLEREGFLIKPNFLWRRHYDKFMLDKTQVSSKFLSHHRTDLFTPNIYFQKELEILGRFGLGAEFSDERIVSTTLGNHSRQHKSIFMDDAKDLSDKLSLGLSFRMDNFEAFDEVYTGSAGIGYKFSKEHSVHFDLSKSTRIPSFTELYYSDPVTVGNLSLSEENSFNFQSGYDYKGEGVSAGITFFLRKETDSIDWVKLAPGQERWQAENIVEAEVFGIENHSRLGINNIISLDYNYTYIDKRIDDGGYIYKYGQNYMRHLANATLSLSLPFGFQTLALTYKKKPARDGWFLLSAGFTYNLNKSCHIFLNITNLLNVEYQEIEGIPQPGRWIGSGIRFEW
ncbi:MAG: TonB-dependent receptor [Candidatus Omnitrophota bacterium]